MPKEYILLCVLIIMLVIVVTLYIIIRKIEKYRTTKYIELISKYEEYLRNLHSDNSLIEYYEKYSSSVNFSLKSKGEVDLITNVELKKHYHFSTDKIFYVINDSMGDKLNIIEKDGKKYIKLDDTTKKLMILISFYQGSHVISKYNIVKDLNQYQLVLDESEVDLNEDKKDN